MCRTRRRPKLWWRGRAFVPRFPFELVQRGEDLMLQRAEPASGFAGLGTALRFEQVNTLFECLGHAHEAFCAVVECHRAQAAVVASNVRPDSST